MEGHGYQWISHKMNIRHPGQLKNWSYQLNSTANLAHSPRNLAKWAELGVLFSWKLQNGSQDFGFFNCHGCQTFILYESYCYPSPQISWHNNSFQGSVPFFGPDQITLVLVQIYFGSNRHNFISLLWGLSQYRNHKLNQPQKVESDDSRVFLQQQIWILKKFVRKTQ